MRNIRRFLADRSGNVAIIVALSFFPLLVIAGGATDIARYEAFRVQLQSGVDRAALAAAALNQTKPTQTTVRDYLKVIDFLDDVTLDIQEQVRLNSKSVTVNARYAMPTAFLPLIGIETLDVVASASAEERRSNIELSLMLDFSGSMASNSKYSRLKTAATAFIDAILTEQTKATTTINIVPYAGQVSVGKTAFDALVNLPANPSRREHNNSSCFEMRNDSDYGTGVISFIPRGQVPHFTVWNATNNTANLNPGWCPSDDTSIAFMSNDAAALKQRIANAKMYDGTGTAIAANWGLMLLDPSSRPMMNLMRANGLASTQFPDRPVAFDDPETLKFIVLMTDGEITEQYTAKDKNKPVRTSNNATQISTKDTNVTRFYKVCDAAKANGVVVFTIGFEANSTAAAQMRKCATSASHFYQVSGLDINSAFQSIATAIQQIRLTQ
ncbi:MAG: hypothetical protein ABS76_27110 [Pelagibacterium sp. SCN 64-44]|nr:MAG: hypothetical protein ABS76_27110 [Pelagibacterium sp. SCN 64-44]